MQVSARNLHKALEEKVILWGLSACLTQSQSHDENEHAFPISLQPPAPAGAGSTVHPRGVKPAGRAPGLFSSALTPPRLSSTWLLDRKEQHLCQGSQTSFPLISGCGILHSYPLHSPHKLSDTSYLFKLISFMEKKKSLIFHYQLSRCGVLGGLGFPTTDRTSQVDQCAVLPEPVALNWGSTAENKKNSFRRTDI